MFSKIGFANLAPKLPEPGLESMKNGVSEKNAAQKWSRNRLALIFLSFSEYSRIHNTMISNYNCEVDVPCLAPWALRDGGRLHSMYSKTHILEL